MLSECRLVLGQATRVFLKRSSDGIRMLNLSLSLLYDDPGGAVGGGGPSSSSSGVRSLDVVCKSGAEFRLWSVGLAYLVQGPPPPASIESHRDSNRAAEERRLVWTALRRDADEATGGFPGTSPGSVRAGPKCGADPIAAAGRTGSLAGEMVVLLSRPSASVPACLATASLTPALAGVSLPMAFAEAVAASQGSKGRGNEIKLALRKARRAANDALAWGEGAWGQLGQGDDRDRDSASLVSALLGRAVRQVAAGAEHSVVLTGERRRRLRCQRRQRCFGGLAPRDDASRPRPTLPPPAADALEAYVWGSGSCGRLGTGSSDPSFAPQLLRTPSGGDAFRFTRVACGARHTLAVGTAGALWAWGDNSCGQLMLGDRLSRLVPCRVDALAAVRVVDAAGGGAHSAALSGETRPPCRGCAASCSPCRGCAVSCPQLAIARPHRYRPPSLPSPVVPQTTDGSSWRAATRAGALASAPRWRRVPCRARRSPAPGPASGRTRW